VEDRTAAVESLLMNVSQRPTYKQDQELPYRGIQNFSKMCYYSTTVVASPNMLAAVGQDVYVHLLFFFFLLFLAGSKIAL